MKTSTSFYTTVLFLSFFAMMIGGCKKKNACDDVACLNGGSCVSGTCHCDALHEGARCEIEKRARYFRSSVGEFACGSSSHFDYVTITAHSDSLNALNFHNLLGEEQNITGVFMPDGTVNIPSQPSGINTISGTAALVNDKLVVNLTVMSLGNTESCTWTERW
jgi:hypothetical protein